MNWLIYISGWFFGGAVISTVIHNENGDSDAFEFIRCVMWTMAWVWFCWKFIH